MHWNSYRLKGLNMEHKGISYVVGRELLGEDWRPDFDPQVVHRELEIIKNDLHCNTVRICSKDIRSLGPSSTRRFGART